MHFQSKKPIALGLDNYFVQQVPTQIAWIYGHSITNKEFVFDVFNEQACPRDQVAPLFTFMGRAITEIRYTLESAYYNRSDDPVIALQCIW